MTETHHEQQNLQLNNLLKKSFGAWVCNHSNQCHLTARPNRNAAANATAATQQTNSMIVTIRISKLTGRKRCITIPVCRTGYPSQHLWFGFACSRFRIKSYARSIPFSTKIWTVEILLFPVRVLRECPTITCAYSICAPCTNR